MAHCKTKLSMTLHGIIGQLINRCFTKLEDHTWSKNFKETVLAVTATSLRPRGMCRCELWNTQTHVMIQNLPVTYVRTLRIHFVGAYSAQPNHFTTKNPRRPNDPNKFTVTWQNYSHWELPNSYKLCE